MDSKLKADWIAAPPLSPWDRLFIRGDGKDIRNLPLVKHPYTGKMHFDHGFWPVDTWAAERMLSEDDPDV